ncbi:hypothetical protein M413DRAFT_164601 [Hebeloma cylindrosporum]|uniref:Uncharacterized protein n=1 Tax=Hebeloma cylindrosporum TaxID=76867 RepID=A0A0C3BVI4_HEBCY|nr:hypothetical protein M413DRAFT_164601 [Hebeloma cylindrosporum h7]
MHRAKIREITLTRMKRLDSKLMGCFTIMIIHLLQNKIRFIGSKGFSGTHKRCVDCIRMGSSFACVTANEVVWRSTNKLKSTLATHSFWPSEQ